VRVLDRILRDARAARGAEVAATMSEEEFWSRAFLWLLDHHGGYESWVEVEALENLANRADAMTKEYRQRYGTRAVPIREPG
jgi:hypothetical protein